MKRRERTRHLIELGGLVVKAKLDELTTDDRTVLYGAFLTMAATLRRPEGAGTIELWRRTGKRAFEAEADADADADANEKESGRRPRAQQGQQN